MNKIRNLKKIKIVWPKFMESDIWIMTVDGTHLFTLEPGDSDVPKDPSYYFLNIMRLGLITKLG
jgi:hypothetical protein